MYKRQSNVDQGYIVRRLLRRAVRYADKLDIPKDSLKEIAHVVIKKFAPVYDNLSDKSDLILDTISVEEMKFRQTLLRGLKEFFRLSDSTISGYDAFVLFSTFGFPFELTKELALERNIPIDEDGFKEEMKKHQDLSRTNSAGKFKGGLAERSEKTTMLHTATHLMLAGLRKYLGEHVHQAGSNITEERSRFDFTHPEKVSRAILDQVENYVNEALSKDCTVVTHVMAKADARTRGVEGSFWEKYPDQVTVYKVQCNDGTVYSQELCGGPHVENTKNIIGVFKIKKEESSSAGVRRVKAVLE